MASAMTDHTEKLGLAILAVTSCLTIPDTYTHHKAVQQLVKLRLTMAIPTDIGTVSATPLSLDPLTAHLPF